MEFADQDESSDQIFVLCRMLFTQRAPNSFRNPDLFDPRLIGGTMEKDWPLEPIEIVDGVPFVVEPRYVGMGSPELPNQYLEYCMTNCDWNTFQYQNKSEKELESALNKLLNSSKWKRPLTPEERDWLAKEIE